MRLLKLIPNKSHSLQYCCEATIHIVCLGISGYNVSMTQGIFNICSTICAPATGDTVHHWRDLSLKMKPFTVKSFSQLSPEVFVGIPSAHAATTTDRALVWLVSGEEARQKWR